MVERKHIEDALRACADAGVPETIVPWLEIRERVLAERRPARRSRFVPRTWTGLAFAVLLVMLFGTVGFAATGWIDEILQNSAPEIVEDNLGVPLNERQTVDGVTFTLERAYADEGNVVVGYSIEGFENWNSGYPTSGPTAMVDGSDRTFEYVGGGGIGTDPTYNTKGGERLSDLAFFDPSNQLDPAAEHQFRFELKLNRKTGGEEQGEGSSGRTVIDTLAFDFRIPVHKLDVTVVGQTVEASGMAVTLERVENSPARAEATFCFDPPRDKKYTWVPLIERPNLSESDVFTNESPYYKKPERVTGCIEYNLFRSLYDDPGVHSVTVTELQGRSEVKVNPDETIEGPWTFKFEVPEQ